MVEPRHRCQLVRRLSELREAGNVAADYALRIIADSQEDYLAQDDLNWLRSLLEEILDASGATLAVGPGVDPPDCEICAALSVPVDGAR